MITDMLLDNVSIILLIIETKIQIKATPQLLICNSFDISNTSNFYMVIVILMQIDKLHIIDDYIVIWDS